MAESVTTNVLNDISFFDCFPYCSLQNGFMNMVTPFLPCFSVFPPLFLGKNLLPAPVQWGLRVLAIKRVGHLHTPPTSGQILLVNRLNLSQVIPQGFLE